MKRLIPTIITVFITLGIFVLFSSALQGFPANQQRTISVLSETSPYTGLGEYYLYVPGAHSTCTWTYVQNGTQQSFTTQPDPKTGQHDFLYNESTSNIQVICLNDQGIKYTGQF
ncbi:hypothetical protein KGO95_02445 [Patescibacteria group bacterium]|nr:hypothetical protein [Patescibacteria group bacterium]